MNWMEHIRNTKARAEKKINIINCLAHSTWGANKGSLLKVHQMIVLSTLRYVEKAYGSAIEAVLKEYEPIHNRGIGLALWELSQSAEPRTSCKIRPFRAETNRILKEKYERHTKNRWFQERRKRRSRIRTKSDNHGLVEYNDGCFGQNTNEEL
jgi:hypothetical protein